MSDSERLKAKLAKLGTREDSGPEGRLIGDGGDLGRALIDEIDETILPRRLIFTTDAGAVLTVEAASRRLVRIVDAPELAPAEAERTTQDGNAGLSASASVIAGFLGDAKTLHVRALPLDSRPSAATVGHAAEALAGRLTQGDGAAAGAAPEGPPLERFLAACGDRPYRVWGEDPRDSGESPALDALSEERRARLAALQGPAPSAIAVTATDGRALFHGRFDEGEVAVDADADSIGPVARAWQAAFGV